MVEQHHIPTAIAGFHNESLLAAFYSTLRQLLEDKLFLDNCYPELVTEDGNLHAKRHLYNITEVTDAKWRGIGIIPASGFTLKSEYAGHDARFEYNGYRDETRKRAGEMPPGCDCARVVLGKIYPTECKLYGAACTPRNPIGPCMVSDEGACRIWWSSVRKPAKLA